MSDVRELITGFRGRVRTLDFEDGMRSLLDMLDFIEQHREELRGAAWPADFPELEATNYRGMLVLCEDELRKVIIKLPLAEDQEAHDVVESFTVLLATLTQRADAVIERLGNARMH